MADTGVSTLTPEESVKNVEKAEEKLETGNGGADHQQPKTDETDHIVITEAEPLAWRPPALEEYQLLFLPVYRDGQCYGLPAGWQVEQRPRTSLKYIGKVDQYYYEPGTNRQFRSLKAVWRHLEAAGQQHEQQPLPGQEKDEQETTQKDEQATRQINEKALVVTQHGDQPEAAMNSGSHSKNKVRRKRKQTSSCEVEQAAKQKDDQTPVVTQHGDQPEAALNSGNHSKKKVRRKRKQASSFEDEHATRQKDEQTLVVIQHGDQPEAAQSSGSHSNSKVRRKRKQASSFKDEQTPVVMQHGDQPEAALSSGSHLKSKVRRKRKQASSFQFDFRSPPEKVTWALVDAENDEWKPFVDGNVVPEAVKDNWAETFTYIVKKKNKAPKV